MTTEDWKGINFKDSDTTIINPRFYIGAGNSSKDIPSNNRITDGEAVPFEKLESDHKYNAKLVIFDIKILNFHPQEQIQKVAVILNISFGEVDENFKYKNKFSLVEQEVRVRFGIKFGRLCLKLTNLSMPLNMRQVPKIEEFNGDVTSMGTDENPEWQFKVKHKSEVPEKASVLFGSLNNQEIGIIELLNKTCQVQATFQVKINSNDLGITEQDGLWDEQTNKKVKETKLRTFFKKVIEPKLENYVSKLELQYDSITIS